VVVAAQPQTATFQLDAVVLSDPPEIDGEVRDDEWAGAAQATDFIQMEPRRGEPSAVRTEVWIGYSAEYVYVGFKAWDPEPPTAQLTQRDANLGSDDLVAVVLDTQNDRRSAYYFATNVLGTQQDGRLGEDGRTSDVSWDAPWTSAAMLTDEGWSAEFAIPLTSLRYPPGEEKTWGINFLRGRRRTLEWSSWAGPVDAQERVSQAGRLVGLTLAAQARRHQVIPYGLSQFQDGRPPDWDAGIDLRYAVTPQMLAYGTLFPDFATIEADQEQINLTRFELSLPEKRPFFLEGQELFSQRIRTFYSRRIADITAGGKLLGRQGPWEIAALTAQSDPTDGSSRANYSVARLQRDIFSRSTIAVMAANRSLDGLNEGSVSMDATLYFTSTSGMTGQLIKSYGRFGRGTMAYFLRPAYDSATAHAHVRYTHLGDRFADNANVIGFIRDDDRRELDSALTKTVWLERGPVERVEYGSNYNIYWGQTGTLRSWQIDQSMDVDFRNLWSTQVEYTEEFKEFEKSFRNREIGLGVGYNTRAFQSVRGGYRFGRNFDADFGLWTGSVQRKLSDELSAEYELQRLTFDPDPDDRSTWIHVLRVDQFFTRDLLVRTFFQTNSAIDRRNVQVVFVYRYQPPFGTIQVAYQRGTAEFGQPSDQGNTLFLKMTTVF
jgi:hypothetical protein